MFLYASISLKGIPFAGLSNLLINDVSQIKIEMFRDVIELEWCGDEDAWGVKFIVPPWSEGGGGGCFYISINTHAFTSMLENMEPPAARRNVPAAKSRSPNE